MSNHNIEIKDGDRFEFGSNWANFIKTLSEEKIRLAEESLKQFLKLQTLNNLTFLDAGSGSGLFSLAARRLGAKVISFDYDPNSVACTRKLKEDFFPGDADWEILEGSVLDENFLTSFGQQDIVYSWGVLHHTGNMWAGIQNCLKAVRPGGLFYVAIYNDAEIKTKFWLIVKKLYCKYGILRPFLIGYAFLLMRSMWVVDGLLSLDINKRWRQYEKKMRGMSPNSDLIDWVGGLPYEVASPEAMINKVTENKFLLSHVRILTGRLGCNEYLFIKSSN